MAANGVFIPCGVGEIVITNHALIDSGKYKGKPVNHSFPIVFWQGAEKAPRAMVIAGSASMCIQMTGITCTDAGNALADALESLLIDNIWDVGLIHDKCPRDIVTWAAYEQYVRRVRQTYRFSRTGVYEPVVF